MCQSIISDSHRVAFVPLISQWRCDQWIACHCDTSDAKSDTARAADENFEILIQFRFEIKWTSKLITVAMSETTEYRIQRHRIFWTNQMHVIDRCTVERNSAMRPSIVIIKRMCPDSCIKWPKIKTHMIDGEWMNEWRMNEMRKKNPSKRD